MPKRSLSYGTEWYVARELVRGLQYEYRSNVVLGRVP